MASLFDAVERPQVIINTNDFDKPKSFDGVPDHHKNILQSTVDKLFGLHGEERYQLWPERLVRDAVSAPHDVMTGQIPTHEVDPVTGEVHTSSGLIKAAQDVSALAGTGGLAGAGSEAGMALGSGPILKSAATEIKPFYSAVENAVSAAKQPKADAQQWLSFLKNQPGVKQEELAHLGLDKLSGSITKDDLLKAVQEGQPQIKEVIKGKTPVVTKPNPEEPHILEVYHPDDPDGEMNGMWGEILKKDGKFTVNVPEIPRKSFNSQKEAEDFISDNSNLGSNTKYHSYQLPGGENYREMLLTLPDNRFQLKKLGSGRYAIRDTENNQFVRDASGASKSFSNASEAKAEINHLHNINESKSSYKSSHWDEPNVLAHIRMNDRNIDGKKSLHLEEIQSDWHQAGRKLGYRTDNKPSSETDDLYRALGGNERGVAAVPDAPFKKTWDELALKKAITYAVKNGYDSISWTPGEAQAARYDLSKQVDAIRANKNPDGTYQIGLKKPGHNMGRPTKEMESVPADKLADFVGKELAEKIIKDVVKPNEHGKEFIDNGKVYSGLDLKVGGQGMKAFYDKMLVDKMRALTKKHGGEVSKSKSGDHDVHVLKITPELREHVLKKGFPLFSAGVPVFSPVDHDPFKKDK